MSEELDTIIKIAGGVLGGGVLQAFIAWLIRRYIHRADRNADQLEADREKKVAKLEERFERLDDRVTKGFEYYGRTVAEAREIAVRTDERLQTREGRRGEPRTNPGARPSDALEAYRAEQAAKEKK